MQYFSGFSLQNEQMLFDEYLIESDYCVAGFSCGAQLALEYVLSSSTRIDRLILLSPAFFQTQKPSFRRAQLRYFEAEQDAYVGQFLKNVAFPSTQSLDAYLQAGNKEELEALLAYRWESEKIHAVLAKGTVIEVFLGGEDKIIDTHDAFLFFKTLTATYLIKGVGHLLQIKDKP